MRALIAVCGIGLGLLVILSDYPMVSAADETACAAKCESGRESCLKQASNVAMERSEGRFSKSKQEEMNKADIKECDAAAAACASACAMSK
jgi:hypothetical protein